MKRLPTRILGFMGLKDDSGEYCLKSSDYSQSTQSLCDTLEGSLELSTLGCKGGTGCSGSTTANNVDLTTLYGLARTTVTDIPAF